MTNFDEVLRGEREATKEEIKAARAERLKIAPERTHKNYRKAWNGRNRKYAVRMFCVECMGYEQAEIPRCTSLACPLYPYRALGVPDKDSPEG